MSQQHDNSVTICNLVVETIGDISYAPQMRQIIHKYIFAFLSYVYSFAKPLKENCNHVSQANAKIILM